MNTTTRVTFQRITGRQTSSNSVTLRPTIQFQTLLFILTSVNGRFYSACSATPTMQITASSLQVTHRRCNPLQPQHVQNTLYQQKMPQLIKLRSVVGYSSGTHARYSCTVAEVYRQCEGSYTCPSAAFVNLVSASATIMSTPSIHNHWRGVVLAGGASRQAISKGEVHNTQT